MKIPDRHADTATNNKAFCEWMAGVEITPPEAVLVHRETMQKIKEEKDNEDEC